MKNSITRVREYNRPRRILKINGKRKNTYANNNALKLNKVDTVIDPTYMDVLEYCKDQPLSRDRLMEIFCDYIYVHRGSCTRSKQLRISSFSFNINSIAAYYEFL
jgi:hypothetical protein